MPVRSIYEPGKDNEQESDLSCDVRIVDLMAVREIRAALGAVTDLQEMAPVFMALGDLTRLKLLAVLSDRPLCTCDLAAVLDVSESAVSHQLRLLKDLGLVCSRRSGKLMIHTVAGDHVRRLIGEASKLVRENLS